MKARPPRPLPVKDLRWRCDPKSLEFETTDDLQPVVGVIGQSSAVEALSFGLKCGAPGQNVFARGITGTGRMTLISRLLEELKPQCDTKQDRCYVHNFGQPHQPRLISLPASTARAFRRRVRELAEFIRDGLEPALEADAIKSRRETVERKYSRQMEQLTEPFERDLREAGLALVSVNVGPVSRAVIVPTLEGRPVPPEEFEQLRAQGKVTEADAAAFKKKREGFQRRLDEVSSRMREIRREGMEAVRAVMEKATLEVLGEMAGAIKGEFPGADVAAFLDEVVKDVVENRVLGSSADDTDPVKAYGVNVLVEHDKGAGCPIIIEHTPTLANLLGTIEREWSPQGPGQGDYRMIRAGSLLKADGGYLILDARDLLSEPGAWKVLVRTLRSARLEIVPSELGWPFVQPLVKPEAIPVQVRVILLGDSEIYHLLDGHDPDFADLFKVLADFDTLIDREPEGTRQYAGVLARIALEEKLPPFHRTAVAALVEHGARVASRGGKLTARFGRIADIAREAAFLACKNGRKGRVTATHVTEAVRRTKRRGDLPSRRFQELLRDGTIRVQTRGEVVGQINGLAVIHAGPLTYGFPARITATMGAGSAGLIDIEEQSALSGSIHTKGFQILGGLLRYLLQTDHPLAFSASLAFEQSYGGIDGDSASGAEICCLISALTGVPIRQGIAMTGAIDQMGHVQAVGGVNEKIEGFFDTCAGAGLTGEQGVIIPAANAAELMLRLDVVKACGKRQFRVYAVETIHEALEILTGMAAGRRGKEGSYPRGSLLALARERAHQFWVRSVQSPGAPAEAPTARRRRRKAAGAGEIDLS